MMKKLVNFFKKIKPSKRKLIQLYSALLYNANIKGFITGSIFTGMSKIACVPGFNCYSCPGAIGACPLGSIQNALAESKTKAPTYVLGIILLYSIIFGRTICGWLCPVGLIQELLYKIKTPKVQKSRITRGLSYFKYVLLFVLVIAIPLIYAFKDIATPLPAFCKYICPVGTGEGALGLLGHSNNNGFFEILNYLFTWKFLLFVLFVVGAIFIYRFFCRFLCPLGALYGFFNKLSILGVEVDKSKCNSCGACVTSCKMDVKHVGDHECIFCGECKKTCKVNAISFKVIDKLIKEEENNDEVLTEQIEVPTKKKMSKKKKFNIIVGSIMAAFLAFVLIYANFIVEGKPNVTTGFEVGNVCIAEDIELLDGTTFNVEDYRGKVVVINFWYTGCTPCVAEIPHFNSLYEKYEDDIMIISINPVESLKKTSQYVEDNFTDFSMLFGLDTDKSYYYALGGNDSFPLTLIIDQNGIINYTTNKSFTYESLESKLIELIDKEA